MRHLLFVAADFAAAKEAFVPRERVIWPAVAHAQFPIARILERCGFGTPYQMADVAGNAILTLLQEATSTTEEKNRRVAEIVEKALHHLRVAKNEIADLQSEVRLHREKSERAEKWLRRIYDETERLFIQEPKEKRVGQ